MFFGCHRFNKKQQQNISALGKVIYTKYYKHWPYTVTHTIDCVCNKILNHGTYHGLNHGLLFSLFKFFGRKHILNQLDNTGLKSRFLFCLAF